MNKGGRGGRGAEIPKTIPPLAKNSTDHSTSPLPCNIRRLLRDGFRDPYDSSQNLGPSVFEVVELEARDLVKQVLGSRGRRRDTQTHPLASVNTSRPANFLSPLLSMLAQGRIAAFRQLVPRSRSFSRSIGQVSAPDRDQSVVKKVLRPFEAPGCGKTSPG